MRLIVYSHDAFGLGNIRRMLAICQHLLATIPEVSILVLSGSPAIHNFKIPARLDYIKLPCLGRDRNGRLAAKYLTSDIRETIKLRSSLIKAAMLNFKPDLVLVDKKPYGLLEELKPALDIIKTRSPQTKLVLLLRDILDNSQKTIKEWQQEGYYEAIQHYYDRVLVVGIAEVFDLVREYQFPPIVAEKTKFCGYIKKTCPPNSTALIRQELGVTPQEKLIVVTPGGGEDGYALIKNYLLALSKIKSNNNCKSLIVFGSEMPAVEREKLAQMIAVYPNIITLDFTERLMCYLQTADLVVSMAGYNTITEIFSLGKKAVVIPRCKPSYEQLIRASRMHELGLLLSIAPQDVTIENFAEAIDRQLYRNDQISVILNFNGLANIQQEIQSLLPTAPTLSLVMNESLLYSYPIAI